jgi:hypothetical protein
LINRKFSKTKSGEVKDIGNPPPLLGFINLSNLYSPLAPIPRPPLRTISLTHSTRELKNLHPKDFVFIKPLVLPPLKPLSKAINNIIMMIQQYYNSLEIFYFTQI